MKGTLYVISAPSGTGKTSLVHALLADDSQTQISISYTTRPKRDSEEQGKDYRFVDEATFIEMMNDNIFLEHAKVFSHYYGTSRKWVEKALNEGIDVLLEIDWQGAEQIRKLFPQCVSIFILPPAKETLKARLEGRGQDKKDVIDERLAEATNELNHCQNYDYLIVNDDFSEALKNLKAIFRANRLRKELQVERLAALIKDLTT